MWKNLDTIINEIEEEMNTTPFQDPNQLYLYEVKDGQMRSKGIHKGQRWEKRFEIHLMDHFIFLARSTFLRSQRMVKLLFFRTLSQPLTHPLKK